MVALTAMASILVFMAALWWLRIVPIASNAVSVMRTALATMGDGELTDLEREKAVQGASLSLLRLFLAILLRGCLALIASATPIVLADLGGIAAGEDVIGFLSRIDVILFASLAMIGIYLLVRRARQSG